MKTIAASIFVLAAAAAPASAAIVISSGATSHMNCSNGVCTPSSKNAVLNVSDLQTMLASGDVTVETANGAQTIGITAPLTWASTSRLTLSSAHSVSFKAAVVVEGTAGLTLVTDKAQPGGDVLFYPGGSVTFWDTASSLSIDGTDYTLVGDLPSLASATIANSSAAYALAKDYDASADGTYDGSPIATLLRGSFEGLGHSISNLSIDVTKRRKSVEIALFHATGPKGIIRDIALTNVAIALGVKPDKAAALVGENNGAIVNSSATGAINATHSDGAFGGLVVDAQTNSRILNSWSGVSITNNPYNGSAGLVAGLVYFNGGVIAGSYATGTLTGTSLAGLVYINGGPITGSHAAATLVFSSGAFTNTAAGLVASNSGAISGSYASDTFSSNNVFGTMSGLAGTNTSAGTITGAWSNSAITMNAGGTAVGLVNENQGTITGSYASGSLSASGDSGGSLAGLVIDNQGTITGSHASGNLSLAGNGGSVAGLVEFNESKGTIVGSYATGSLSGQSNGNGGVGLGGFIITNQGSISQSYETGSVTDSGPVEKTSTGGFAAVNSGTIANSYALGAVTGNRKAYTGGFVGSLDGSGSITASYSTGLITGGRNPNTQGFVAFVSGGTVTDGYWDVDTSGQNKSKAGTPISDAALKEALPAGLDPAVWAQDSSINNGYPYLIANPPQ